MRHGVNAVMKRKAISPLIAVVLLVVFTIGIGIIVSSWLSGYTKSTTESAGTASSEVVECAKQIIDISDVYYNNTGSASTVKVRITNLGQVTTYVRKITAMDPDGEECLIADYPNGNPITKGDEKYYTNTSCPSTFDYVKSVRATTLCSGVADEWTNTTS